MNPALVVAVGLGAVLAMQSICHAAGTDENTTRAFVVWAGLPYVGYTALAFERRFPPDSSRVVLIATTLGAGLATALYRWDLRPLIIARSTGVEVMACGGPLVEFGVPIVQWMSVGLLWRATRPGKPEMVAN